MIRFVHLSLHLPLIACMALLAACNDDTPRLDEEGNEVGTLESEIEVQSPTFNIINILRASGLKVRVPKTASRPELQTKGYVFDVNNGVMLEVYEYASTDDLTRVKGSVSPDGAMIGDKKIEWGSPVHLYNTEKIIIAYMGHDVDTRQSLASIFGEEFAGTR